MRELVFEILGLDCANCAAKIEEKISNLSFVGEANLDFLAQKLRIKTSGEISVDEITSKIQSLIDSVESGVLIRQITQNGSAKTTQNNQIMAKIAKIAASGVIFGVALVGDFNEAVKFWLFLASYLIIGLNVLITAVKNITKGSVFDENFLMAIATIGAFCISEYPEAVAVMLFYQVGELLESIAVGRSRKSIANLMDIKADFANLKRDNKIQKVPPQAVKIGDLIVVKPGEKVPLDGQICEGVSAFDTSALSGESIPKDIGVGGEVLSGYINKSALVTIKVSQIFSLSTASKILDLVENASSKKSKTENFITKFAKIYTPAIVIIAAIIATIVPICLGEDFGVWIYKALVFLVISCPCALVVSIPLGFFGGIAGASRQGVLVKGSSYLEALNSVDTVVFDKTGTLSKGVFEIEKITLHSNSYAKSKADMLKLAAYAEFFSTHPISRSVLRAYKSSGENINEAEISGFEEVAGGGVRALVNGLKVVAGNEGFLLGEGVKFEPLNEVKSVVYMAVEGEFVGGFVIGDELKKDAKIAIKKLREEGVKEVIMLSGDSDKIAKSVAHEIGIDEVFAQLLPHQKVQKLEEILAKKSGKGKVAFVGDGINDAPVLARSDVGVAMGGVGSDAAIEAADVVIMNDEPCKVATAIKIAKKTRLIIWQNIAFALGAKALIMGLGLLGYASMWMAVFGDVGVALIAILNSLRAMR